jgi:hypothetical protein
MQQCGLRHGRAEIPEVLEVLQTRAGAAFAAFESAADPVVHVTSLRIIPGGIAHSPARKRTASPPPPDGL